MKKGFTIIELLVVSALIALLASVIFTAITGTRARSRDSRREVDIKEIQNAMNLYAINNRSFPVCPPGCLSASTCTPEVVIDGSRDCLSTLLLAAGAMSKVPVDPLGKASGACGDPVSHVYCFVSDGVTYTLRHHLETNSIQGKAAGWQSVGP